MTEQTLCVSHHDGHFIHAVQFHLTPPPGSGDRQLYFIAEENLFGYTNTYLWSKLLRRLRQDHFKLDNAINWRGGVQNVKKKLHFLCQMPERGKCLFLLCHLTGPSPLVSEQLNVSVKSCKLNHLQQVSGRDRKL